MQKIITCLGFNDQAEEAVNFYTSTVRNSKILKAMLQMTKLDIAALQAAHERA